jgi:cytochrome b561
VSAAAATEPRMAPRHHPRTIALHWLTAAAVVLAWFAAQCIDAFPKGPSRWNMLGVHMTLGASVGALVVARLRWRYSRRADWPAPAGGRVAQLARHGHIALYALVAGTVLLGLWNAWARGEHVFGLFQIPAFDADDKALRKWAGDAHKLAANALLILAGAHAAIAAVHHLVFRDEVLLRMLPARFARTSVPSSRTPESP